VSQGSHTIATSGLHRLVVVVYVVYKSFTYGVFYTSIHVGLQLIQTPIMCFSNSCLAKGGV
jgi:hypothetical protein